MTRIDEAIEFGAQLLKAQDLDPVYDFLYARFVKNWQPNNAPALKRWLLAYSMFYHAGVCEYMAFLGEDKFWAEAERGVKEFPHGEERRHFRGDVAVQAIHTMAPIGSAEIVRSWYAATDYASVSKAVRQYPLYGHWIAFKLADMGERILQVPVSFANCELGIYDEPRSGAALALCGEEKHKISASEVGDVARQIYEALNARGFMAPPSGNRPLNIQEAETILCKWKSFVHGHYRVGKDIEAVNRALEWRP